MSEFRIFIDPDDLFQIQVPTNWETNTTAFKPGEPGYDPNFKIEFLDPEKPEKGMLRPNVGLNIGPFSPLSQEEYIINGRLELKQASKVKDLHRDESINSDTHLFEWIFQQTPVVGWQRLKLIFKSNKVYTLVGTSGLEQCEDIFDTIFDSFRVKESE